jgi:hypothetical protein
VISTTELAGTKRSGLGIHGCWQRPAKVACVQTYIHLFATPVCPIPEYATGTSTAHRFCEGPGLKCPGLLTRFCGRSKAGCTSRSLSGSMTLPLCRAVNRTELFVFVVTDRCWFVPLPQVY